MSSKCREVCTLSSESIGTCVQQNNNNVHYAQWWSDPRAAYKWKWQFTSDWPLKEPHNWNGKLKTWINIHSDRLIHPKCLKCRSFLQQWDCTTSSAPSKNYIHPYYWLHFNTLSLNCAIFTRLYSSVCGSLTLHILTLHIFFLSLHCMYY